MIILTGDTHGDNDIYKLNSTNFTIGKTLTKNDYIIILGDFGFIWNNDETDKYWLNWLDEKPWTTLFIDGNHENHTLLSAYPVENWNGGKIHKINDSVIHLMRGQVFTIENKKFMTMGGAYSIDKEYRNENISWWPTELPNDEEYSELLTNLELNNYTVDYVLTHTCPMDVFYRVVNNNKEFGDKQLERFFLSLKSKLNFKCWYFGHFHVDILIDDKHRAVYYDKIMIDYHS